MLDISPVSRECSVRNAKMPNGCRLFRPGVLVQPTAGATGNRQGSFYIDSNKTLIKTYMYYILYNVIELFILLLPAKSLLFDKTQIKDLLFVHAWHWAGSAEASTTALSIASVEEGASPLVWRTSGHACRVLRQVLFYYLRRRSLDNLKGRTEWNIEWSLGDYLTGGYYPGG